jgi:2-iminobutanoate/2-iminopropanoate deaminase
MSSGQFNRQPVSTEKAPAAIGPYSQAVRSGSLLFVSGQIALDPSSGELANRDVTTETRQVLQNLGAILTAAGTSFDRVVKTTVYLLDMSDFAAMNEVYQTAFRAPAPARATVAVAGLPRGARVEIELIAEL